MSDTPRELTPAIQKKVFWSSLAWSGIFMVICLVVFLFCTFQAFDQEIHRDERAKGMIGLWVGLGGFLLSALAAFISYRKGLRLAQYGEEIMADFLGVRLRQRGQTSITIGYEYEDARL